MAGIWTPGATATQGDDSYVGDDADEFVDGLGGDDTLSGEGGDDELFGSDGNDALNGNDGHDALVGGQGDDVLNGGAGDDLLMTGDAVYAHRTPTDGWSIAYYALLGGGNDVIDGGAGHDMAMLFYADRTQSVHFDAGVGEVITITVGGAYAGSVTNVEAIDFFGGSAGDVVDFRGATVATGGTVEGKGGDDVISGGIGSLAAWGGDGADTLTGGAGYSALYGDDGDDHLIAAAGGSGQMHGGRGNDVLDATGSDYQLDYTDVTGPNGVVIDLAAGTAHGVSAGVDTLIGFSTVFGSVNADTITGDALANHLIGWEGDDTIHGGGGDDTLEGTRGNDQLFGGDGDDTLLGAWGDDTLYGEAGNDTLTGGDDADTLDGGVGDDFLKGDDGDDVLAGGGGADHLWGGLGDDTVDGGAGDDLVESDLGDDILAGGAGTDVLTYEAASAGVVVSLLLTGPQDTHGAGVDIISGFETLRGSDYADTLTGASAFGRAGDDDLIGTTGADALHGGAGNDIIEGGLGDDVDLHGDDGEDQISGGGGDDHLYGDLGNDFLQGGDGADLLQAGDGSDVVDGGAGDDVIIGLTGGDTLTGGAGKDVFLYGSGYDSLVGAADTITDFQTGEDVIDLSTMPLQWATITQTGGTSVLSLFTNYGQMQIDVHGAVAASDLRISGSFQLHQTIAGGGVSISGSPIYDTIFGGQGDDVIWGRGGGDNLGGGSGRDVFKYTASSESDPAGYDIIVDFATGSDKIDLGAMAPSNVSIIRYNGGAFVNGGSAGGAFQIGSITAINGSDIVGLASGVYLVGENVGATLVGSDKGDAIVGGTGDDVIIGGEAGDALYGRAGTNTFSYASAADSDNAHLDIIHDFKTGVDKIDLTAMAASNVSIIRYNGGAFVNGGGIGGALQIGSINAINGSDIIGLTSGVYLVGENVANTLIGGDRGDTIVGGAASDTIIGGDTGDALFGGAGADTFVYRSATESNPNAGQMDIIHDFQTGVDKLDLTALGASNVSILHYQGGTFIAGGSASGTFQIASMKDINATDIVGLTSGAYIVGDELANTLIGNGASETIIGGAGNDTIIGGGADDALFGGAGADTFKFTAKGDSTPAASDIIHDFQTGVDKIDLTALHANGANDHYSLISDATASYLFVQLAGNPANDMQILIANPNVHGSDILW